MLKGKLPFGASSSNTTVVSSLAWAPPFDSTPVNAETSSRGALLSARVRNRLLVALPSRTGASADRGFDHIMHVADVDPVARDLVPMVLVDQFQAGIQLDGEHIAEEGGQVDQSAIQRIEGGAAGEALGVLQIRVAGLPPEQVGMFGEGNAALDAMIDAGAVAEAEEAFGRPLAGEPLVIALVDVGGDQLGALGVGAADDQRRHARHVRGEARGVALRISRAAKRMGKATDTWVVDGTVYFKIA